MLPSIARSKHVRSSSLLIAGTLALATSGLISRTASANLVASGNVNAADKFKFSATGTVANGDGGNQGFAVYAGVWWQSAAGQLQNPTNWTRLYPGKSPAITDATGAYNGTTQFIDPRPPNASQPLVNAASDIGYVLFAQRLTGSYQASVAIPVARGGGFAAQYNFTYQKGAVASTAINGLLAGANVKNSIKFPGTNNTVTVNGDNAKISVVAKVTRNIAFRNNQASVGGTFNGIDPMYNYSVTDPSLHTGVLSFASDFDATDPNIPIDGITHYANNDEANGDNVDESGNPINENYLDNNIQISNLNVTGLDGSGNPIFGTGTIKAVDENDATLWSGDIIGVHADVTDGLWYADIGNAQFPDEGSSETLAEWDAERNAGGEFELALDPSFIGMTNNFSQSATMDGTIVVGDVVPEPASLSVLAIGAAMMLRRRRS